jgi:hypothetical protein
LTLSLRNQDPLAGPIRDVLSERSGRVGRVARFSPAGHVIDGERMIAIR